MLNIDWQIQFTNGKKSYTLGMVSDITIESSVDTLADTATITLPEAVMNQTLKIQDKVHRGTEVVISAGYDKSLKTEFVGYVKEVVANDSSLKIVCEDALFLFRKEVKSIELKPTSVKKIGQYIIDQVNSSYRLVCDYDVSYEKFVIHQATGYDVLKKIAEETKANIYFDTKNKKLHIHSPYLEKGGEVVYSLQKNIEKSSLEFKKAIDRKVEITVESTNTKGKVESFTTGNTGGDKITLKAGSINKADLRKIANAELIRRSADMYDGSIDAWLVPFVQPSYSATIIDEDYPEKTGKYYVVGVTTSINEGGAKRTIKLGVKLSS